MSKAKELNSGNFEAEVLKSQGVVLVDFWAPWCVPCKMVGPVLDEIAEELSDIKIVKVNVDDEQELAGKYGIRSIPTMIIFKNGEKVDQMIGALPKGSIKAKLEANK